MCNNVKMRWIIVKKTVEVNYNIDVYHKSKRNWECECCCNKKWYILEVLTIRNVLFSFVHSNHLHKH